MNTHLNYVLPLANTQKVGGCWVTFEKILFDPHLHGLNPNEVKEYVKLRVEADPKSETDIEAKSLADTKAVLQAKAVAATQEAASPKPAVPRRQYNRKSLPEQPIHKTPGFQAVNAADLQTPKSSPSVSIERPTGVLLGYWADSSEPVDADKHAAYGVLSGSDCFRVKVQKITRDGRFMEGNIPVGAGSMWISYEKVVLDPHLAMLERSEVKEYCRIRQQDLEHRESENERKANELRAVQRAQAVVAEQKMSGRTPETVEYPEMELRQSVRSAPRQSSRYQAPPVDEAAMMQLQREKAEARERQIEQTRREVAAAEAALRAPGPEAGVQEAAQMELKNNIKKLNKVWIKQQAATMPGGMSPGMPMQQTPMQQMPMQQMPMQQMHAPMGQQEMEQQQMGIEVRYHNGIKYETKTTGLLQGKMVSPAQLLNIDGEDYVEYRVLVRPSF